jgi:hypothetical protein
VVVVVVIVVSVFLFFHGYANFEKNKNYIVDMQLE